MDNAFRSIEPSDYLASRDTRLHRAQIRRGIADMRLVKFLLRKDWLTQIDAAKALSLRSETGRSLDEVLVQHHMVTPQRLHEAFLELKAPVDDLEQANFHWY